MSAPVVHFEINSAMAPQLHEFYSKLFGWSINADNPMSYGLVETNGGFGIGGGIGPAQGPNLVTFYVAVPDTDATLARIEQLGGTIVLPTTVIPNMVTMALFSDPDGNIVGLVKDEQTGETYAPKAGPGRAVVHFEVLGRDQKKLQSFYAGVFGWAVDASNPQGYGMVPAEEGRGIGGGIGASQDGAPAVTWYVDVDDLAATLEQVAKLGGKRAVEPMDVMGQVEIAAFHDPEGNLIGLVRSTHDHPHD